MYLPWPLIWDRRQKGKTTMDWASITSTDIPAIVQGFAAARAGQPFDHTASDLWKAGYIFSGFAPAETLAHAGVRLQ